MISLVATRLWKSYRARGAVALAWVALSGCNGVVALGTLESDDASTRDLPDDTALSPPTFDRRGLDTGVMDTAGDDAVLDSGVMDAAGDDAGSGEESRVTLHRCQGSVANAGCARVDGEWDHCFSTTRELCDCADIPGDPSLIWQPDGVTLKLYRDRPGPDARIVNGLSLQRLYGCVEAARRERRYVLADDPYRDRAGVTCRGVGFVAASAQPDAGLSPVWESHLPIVTDYLYSAGTRRDDVEAVCHPAVPRVVWWAWE